MDSARRFWCSIAAGKTIVMAMSRVAMASTFSFEQYVSWRTIERLLASSGERTP